MSVSPFFCLVQPLSDFLPVYQHYPSSSPLQSPFVGEKLEPTAPLPSASSNHGPKYTELSEMEQAIINAMRSTHHTDILQLKRQLFEAVEDAYRLRCQIRCLRSWNRELLDILEVNQIDMPPSSGLLFSGTPTP